jgi:hypothetical protein
MGVFCASFSMLDNNIPLTITLIQFCWQALIRFDSGDFLSQFLHKLKILKNPDNMGKVAGYIKVTPFELASESPIYWAFLIW